MIYEDKNTIYEDNNFGRIWFRLLRDLYRGRARGAAPRGQMTRELLNVHLTLSNPLLNVLDCKERNPSYRFMVAEWLWIWFGHDDVASIARYNPHISQFSDDGVIFKGAYGPKVFGTMLPLVNQLRQDPDSRQAIIQIYRRPDGQTKDVPCTLTAQFLLRDGGLNLVVNMRSSDIWLGLPYDAFNFTMIQNAVAAMLGARLGSFHMNLGSSHLYERNFDAARRVLDAKAVDALRSPTLPCEPPRELDEVLTTDVEPFIGLRRPWWTYAAVLRANTNLEAYSLLRAR